MKLLTEKELIWSSVVANCNMNRKRSLLGINSYEKDIGINIIEMLKQKATISAEISWLDLCCGEGNALIQAAKILQKESCNKNIQLEGIDLVDMFSLHEQKDNLILKTGSLIDWNPNQNYDLITCVHGLHYIGDKLLVLTKIAKSLKENGEFIGNIDFDNLRDTNGQSLKTALIKYLNAKGCHYNAKKKILRFKGYRLLKFEYAYIGADEKAGKNYTGQEVVNSIYKK